MGEGQFIDSRGRRTQLVTKVGLAGVLRHRAGALEDEAARMTGEGWLERRDGQDVVRNRHWLGFLAAELRELASELEPL